MTDPIRISIHWSPGVAAEVRATLATATQTLSTDPDWSPALRALHFAWIGSVQVACGDATVFRPSPGSDRCDDVTVLLVLLALRSSLERVLVEGTQVMLFGPDWDELTMSQVGELFCAATEPSHTVCGTRAAWMDALDGALDEVRNWIRADVPELCLDPQFGPWLTGNGVPRLPNLTTRPATDGHR